MCIRDRLYPELGLTQDDAELIGMAAVFCDIGLLGIPDEAAMEKDQKSGKSDLYYQHTQLGYELFSQEMSGEPLLRYAAEIALWHHKNINGSGYPLEKDEMCIRDSPAPHHTNRGSLSILTSCYWFLIIAFFALYSVGLDVYKRQA